MYSTGVMRCPSPADLPSPSPGQLPAPCAAGRMLSVANPQDPGATPRLSQRLASLDSQVDVLSPPRSAENLLARNAY